MTYQSISFLGFDPLPDFEHLRLDTTTVEELNYLAQRLDSLSDEQFIIYQALFDQRFGDVDSDELLSVKDLINMTYGLDSVMVASNIHNDEQLGQFVIENDLHPDVAAIPDNSLYLLDKRRIGELQRKNEGGVLIDGFYVVTGDYEMESGTHHFTLRQGRKTSRCRRHHFTCAAWRKLHFPVQTLVDTLVRAANANDSPRRKTAVRQA